MTALTHKYTTQALFARTRRRTRQRIESLQNHGIPPRHLLRGQTSLPSLRREFCGKPETHPYELLLAIEDIEHRTPKIRSPRTNGFVERMNRTLLDECFRVEGRKTWYIEPEEIQRDLDTFLTYYNVERTHQGYRLEGRTPAQAMMDALEVEELPSFLIELPEDTDTGTAEAA